jgi:hypothetical protein
MQNQTIHQEPRDTFRYISILFDTSRCLSILSPISFDTFRYIPSILFRYVFDILRYFFDTFSILVSKASLLKLSRCFSILFDTFFRYFFDTFSIFFDTFSIRFRYKYRKVSCDTFRYIYRKVSNRIEVYRKISKHFEGELKLKLTLKLKLFGWEF